MLNAGSFNDEIQDKQPLRFLVIFGTRPEAIKLAPVIQHGQETRNIEMRVVATGQHREMADGVLEFFGITPHHRLDVMRPNQDLASVTALMLSNLQPILSAEKPDAVFAQGDTVSCFAAALASFYARVPLFHVEAGLRTNDLAAPFPEEGIRQMVSRLTSLHFAATEANKQALLKENINPEDIVVTGNTVIDAVLAAQCRLSASDSDPLRGFSTAEKNRILQAERIVLMTGHRRESFGAGLKNICGAIQESAAQHPNVLFVYPVHPNPNVAGPVRQILAHANNVVLLSPLDYPAFVYLMSVCFFAITDSGGVQEEAPALGKPVLVTRDKTERQEAVETGQVRLVGTHRETISAAIDELLTNQNSYNRMARKSSPYGDGHAAERIIEHAARRSRVR